MPAISFDVVKNLLPKDKQQAIINSVFGPEKATTNAAPAVTPTTSQQARENFDNSLQAIFDKRRENLEKQRSSDVRMARVNALGNILTSLVQPIGWAIGGKGTGVTGGVQKYDDRQYLDAFNRAVKASDDLRNLGAAEDEYKLRMAYDDYSRAVNEEQRQRVLKDEEEAYRKRRELDAQYGVNRAKTGDALNEERRSKAIESWTIHNNGMSLWQYVNSINSTFPGYFGENWTPDKAEIDRIEAEIRRNKPKATTVVKPPKPKDPAVKPSDASKVPPSQRSQGDSSKVPPSQRK